MLSFFVDHYLICQHEHTLHIDIDPITLTLTYINDPVSRLSSACKSSALELN